MSTRATYQFKSGSDFVGDITLYIHHDGYPEGAANYFLNAFNVSGQLDVESMIRGNDRAEITGSHETHADTDYRYTFEKGNVLVQKYSRDDTWSDIYSGSWVDFINTYVPLSGWVPDFTPLQRLKIGPYGGNRVWSKAGLEENLKSDMDTMAIWMMNGHDRGANWDNLMVSIREAMGHIKAWPKPAVGVLKAA